MTARTLGRVVAVAAALTMITIAAAVAVTLTAITTLGGLSDVDDD